MLFVLWLIRYLLVGQKLGEFHPVSSFCIFSPLLFLFIKMTGILTWKLFIISLIMFRLKTTDTEYLIRQRNRYRVSDTPYLTYRNFSKCMQSFNMHLSKPSQIGVDYVLFFSQLWVVVLMQLMSHMMPAMLRVLFISCAGIWLRRVVRQQYRL